MSQDQIASLKDIATRLRIRSITSTNKAGSGHPTSCCSAADLVAGIFFHAMRFDAKQPRLPANDRFVLSKGHAAPLLYAAWAEAGFLAEEELLHLRELNCDLEGHPTPKLPFVDVATGSLGQGLSAGCGMAYSSKYLDRTGCRTYVLMGDGESAEGSVWEALSFAGHYKLDNLVAAFDINRLGQSEPTMLQHDLETYRHRLEAFGWDVKVIDGHDMATIVKTLDGITYKSGKPTAIVAKTLKGKGIKGIEDLENWHGKALGDKAPAALADLQSQLVGAQRIIPPIPSEPPATYTPTGPMEEPSYKMGEKIATRQAYGTALAKLGKANQRVVALDGDTKNSTFADKLKAVCPDRFVECFIAEQNLVGVAVGLATREKISFASTFAAFFSRAYDQIRMGAISLSSANFVGSHAGVSIGEDGPSQMALEDIAMFRAIPEMTVFYPSDAVSTERAVALAAAAPKMTFLRSSRPVTPVIYGNDEKFEIGKAKVVRQSSADKITIIGAGITLYEAMKAADTLAKNGIAVRVIDPFTIKPLDAKTILSAAKETGGLILTVEDHYPEGGIGDAVAGELATERDIVVYKLAVREIPRSGKPEELLAKYGIDADAIVRKVTELVR